MSTFQLPDLTPNLVIRDGIFDNTVTLDKWEVPESSKFPAFVNETFTSSVRENIDSIRTGESVDSSIRVWNSEKKDFDEIKPFNHQLFVKNYLNNKSPYRGLLLYHGLGSGKSGASVVIAEGFSNKQVVIMLPASLATNYKSEILKFGSQSYKIKNHWVFVPFELGSLTEDNKGHREQVYEQFTNLGISKTLLKKIIKGRKQKKYAQGIWLIDNSKQYPNYITSEEKRDLEEYKRIHNNPDDTDDTDDTEVIDILTDSEKEEITQQTNVMNSYKYRYIHTNAGRTTITSILLLSNKFIKIKKKLGITVKNSQLDQNHKLQIMDEMYRQNINPFDNKVVVIDEVHNFAASIASSGFNAPIIYELLMRANNIKLVLLSGTPVINNAYELAIICNLLKGFTKTYAFTLLSSISDTDEFKTRIKQNKSIFNYRIENKKLKVILNPDHFQSIDDNMDNFSVVINSDPSLHKKSFVEKFQAFMATNNYPIEEDFTIHYTTLFDDILSDDSSKWANKDIRVESVIGDTADTADSASMRNRFLHRLISPKFKKKSIERFSEKYIRPEDLTVINVIDFKKRILGIISFYNEVASADRHNPIFPDIAYADTDEIEVVMSDYQFKLYVQEREVERKYEELGKRMSAIDTIFNTANLFKVYSRTMGIMVFPPNIIRPRHSALKKKINAEHPSINKNDEKKLLEKVYIEQCYDAIGSLRPSNFNYKDVSEPFNLNVLSPKYTLLLKNIEKTQGLVFGYSQFRSIEGIGLLTKVLENNGYYRYSSDVTKDDITFTIKDKVRFESDTDQWQTYVIISIDNEDDASQTTVYNISTILGDTVSTTKDKIFRCTFSLWTGEEDVETRKKLLNDFNNETNKYGNECLILLTTSAGAEGISLMNVRQVHILEPYWNNVRIKQVIGRARRVRSHILLPNDQRNVKIFQYIIRFSDSQKKGTWIQADMIKELESSGDGGDDGDGADDATDEQPQIPITDMSSIIMRKDKGLTSDETLYNIASNKSNILDKFLKIFKEVAVDCEFNKIDNIKTEDIDVIDPAFNCYVDLYDADDDGDGGDKLSINILSEDIALDAPIVDDSSIIKEKKNILIINQPKLRNGVHLHSLILDVPIEYNLPTYLEQRIGQKIPLYNLYSYYAIDTPSSQKILIGHILMNLDRTYTLRMDNSLFTFDIIKKYLLIEQAIDQIASSIKTPLRNYSEDITASETVKWVTFVKEKINELQSRETWTCKICKKTYSLSINNCSDHPRITKRLCKMLENKKLKKELRLI